jgi:Protein of unknown function (DUF2800)
MPSRHSAIVGGSSAARLVNCPGSPALLARVPKVTQHDSFYSIEGTALHEAMVQLITGQATLDQLLGTEIDVHGTLVEITPTLLHDALAPALAYWNAFLMTVDNWALEAEVEFPGIEGAFGTADVLARDDLDNITYINDWKFGAGKGVTASYISNGRVVPNEQLMFYATAARHCYPEWFPAGCRVVLTIVQPRARDQEPVTSVEVTLADLDAFQAQLVHAVTMDNPPTHPGHWCEFQPCKTICPHHTGPLFDLTAIGGGAIPQATEPDHMDTLLRILDAAPLVENLIREARAQAHLMLGNGEPVPGWKLVAKRGTRQWTVDPGELAKQLRPFKLNKAALFDSVLKSPAQVEKLLPPKTKLPNGLATLVVSGTTIAKTTDKRPAISGDPNELPRIMVEVLGEGE